MTLSIGAFLFALVSFIATFLIARALSKSFRARRARRAEEEARRGQSRQVRRAQQRKGRG